MDLAAAIATTLGTAALVGAGSFVRWIGPRPLGSDVLRLVGSMAAVAAGLVVAGSLADAYDVLARVARGAVDPSLYVEYLLYARHGRAAAARVALAVVLAWWAVRTDGRARTDAAYGVAALALLASLSVVSHSGTVAATGLVADLGHWLGTGVWAGALGYLAWLPVWGDRPAAVAAVARLSRIGGASVAVLAATGVALATLNLYGPTALLQSDYGLVLLAKLGLVGLVLQAAAVQRFALLPHLHRGGDPLRVRRVLRLEALLLATVLVAAAVLTTREPARTDPGATSSPVTAGVEARR